KQVLRFRYTAEDGRSTQRTVRPLALLFWGRVWTLAAWCELRRDFRSFRADRMQGLKAGPRTFKDEPGKTLKDFQRRVRREPHPALA
ncbi:MAG TPA: WYL domain-containing protein, partial [bacterium]|nr:WYL domain-containing protein [bacterium]